MKRYEKFVLEAEKGITFEVSEGTSGELIIRALNIATSNVYSENYANPPVLEGYKHVDYENYANPPVPEGYKHVCGEWNNGFVIERCSDRSQFVWIPVGSLDPNGTLDGEHFSEKFGRRNYMNDEFAHWKFNEPLSGELGGLLEQLESVKKYGGFYISRYHISMSSAGKPQSVKGVIPWVGITFYDAKKIASTIENNEAVKSHLTFGAEYDSVLEWFIKTEVKTLAEITNEWGNKSYRREYPLGVIETGSTEEGCDNKIYDFTGNVMEWTQEQEKKEERVIRGDYGYIFVRARSASYRMSRVPYFADSDLGFRAALYIK